MKGSFAAFFGKRAEFRRTFGAQLYAEIKKDIFFAKARRYPTAVESALDPNAVPVEVYRALVENVDKSLPTFHRYLKLRKRMMGLSDLHYYDLYAPLVSSVKLQYTPEEAQKLVLGAVAPLGPEYAATIQRALSERWIDWMPLASTCEMSVVVRPASHLVSLSKRARSR